MHRSFIRLFNTLNFILWVIIVLVVVLAAALVVGVALGLHVPTMFPEVESAFDL